MTATTTTRPTLRQDERGIALAIAIFALVIIATLVTGVFYMARLEQRSGNNALWSLQATEAAEAGLSATLANWDPGNNTMLPGTAQTLPTVPLGNRARYTATVRKVTNQIYLIESRGERLAGTNVLSGAKVGRIVRMVTANVNVNAALTANGPVGINGNVTIDGRDSPPPAWSGWPGCPAQPDVAGLRTSNDTSQSGKAAKWYGDPPVVINDATVTSPMIRALRDELLALMGSGDVTISGNYDGALPAVPIVHIKRIVDQNGNVLQDGNYNAPANHDSKGILLIDGNFSTSGNFDFTGIIIALGVLNMSGTPRITGAVLSDATIGHNIQQDITFNKGTPTIEFSSCSINAALSSAASIRPLNERSWVQLF